MELCILKSKINLFKCFYPYNCLYIGQRLFSIRCDFLYLIDPFFSMFKKLQKTNRLNIKIKINKKNVKTIKYKNKDLKKNWIRYYFINIVKNKKYFFMIYKNFFFKNNWYLLNKHM
uniref:Uncharacterized protein n=1 Tax=Lotharella vacuolata TaxID=74820 RepID=A0A0H5BL69_9EUKA|nr:hypothetical protein [Lotharella vacuolata]